MDKDGFMKIRLIVSMLLIIMMVVFYSVAGAAGKFIVDDFSNAAPEGNSINSNGRTWISFGGLKITLSEKSIQARGNLSVWGGFFIEPGYRGVYGIPIPVNDKSKISIVYKGKVPKIKIELYDT
ncbi:MAG: hypothetical protein HQK97_05205, partial [Nitrospirae bacterium]|nr:hypothetical protein [Nitrospirota bacterium]